MSIITDFEQCALMKRITDQEVEKPDVFFVPRPELIWASNTDCDGVFFDRQKLILLDRGLEHGWLCGTFIHEATHWVQAVKANWQMWNACRTRQDIYDQEFEAFKNQIAYCREYDVSAPKGKYDIKTWTDELLRDWIEFRYEPIADRILRAYAEQREEV